MILSVLVFICCSSLISLLLSCLFGHLTGIISAVGLIGGLGISYLIFEKEKPVFWSRLSRGLGISLFCAGSFQFIYLFFEKNMGDVQYYTLNPNNLGDLPFHINMIKAIGRGLHFWPENPILVGEILKYPFGMNLFNAQFEVLGVPIEAHLMLVGCLCLGLSIFLLHRWMGAWGLIVFFMSGGYGSFSELLSGNSWASESHTAWKNLFLAVFVTQRGLMFALPAGVYLLSQFSDRYLSDSREPWSLKKKISLGLIWGSLGFFHLHSFFILSLFIGLLILWKRDWRSGLWVASLSLAIASPFLVIALLPSPAWVSPIHMSWGWMMNESDDKLLFWIRNFGAWLTIFPVLLWLACRHRQYRFLIGLAILLFIIFINLMLAPWAWDQIKILLWCYLFLSWVFYEIAFKNLKSGIKICLGIMIFYPGAIQLWRSLPMNSASQAVSLFRKSEIDSLKPLLKDVGPNERIFTASRYNHPVFFFGQSVVMGYAGHIWSHGYSPVQIENKIKAVLNKSANLSRFKDLGASYILSSHYEAEDFGPSWLSNSMLEGQNAAWILVKVPEIRSE